MVLEKTERPPLCSEEHDFEFDSATTDARESVESAEHGGKPSS